MNREDIEFLRELQNELRTQTNDGNAQPVYWGVIEEKNVAVSEGCGSTMIYDREDFYSLEEIVNQLQEEYDLWDCACQEQWDSIDHNDIGDVVCFCNDFLECDYLIEWEGVEDVLSRDTGAFLTKRACQNYIDEFGYNHCKPRTYAMTACRNFELERLLNILTNMNIDDIKVEE